MYTYHSPRVTVPILAVWIFIFKYINIFSSGKLKVQFNDSFNWKNFIGPVILGLILLFPVAKQMIGVQGQARIIGSSITYYWGEPTYLLKLHDNVIRAHELDTEMFFRPYMFLNDGFTKFLAYISPAQLAEFGDAVDRHHVPNMGRILVVELVFAIIGLAFAMKHKNYLMKYIGLFVIAGMLPASVTRDEFHSIRSLFMAVPIAMFVGVGISAIEKYRKTLILLLLIWFGSFGFYFVIYQITVPRERSIGYQYGMQAATKYIKEHYDEYDQVIIDPPEIYGNPYIHVLSYLNYDSSKYQATVSRGDNYERNPPIAEVYGFDKFLFRPIYLPEDRNLKRTLLVGTVENLPMDQIKEIPNGKLQEEIKDPGGKTLIRLFAVQ